MLTVIYLNHFQDVHFRAAWSSAVRRLLSSLFLSCYSWLISNGFRDFQIENIKIMIFNAILHERKLIFSTANLYALKQGRMKWRNCRLTPKTPDYYVTWLGFLGCQQAAGYPKTQFLSYAVKILPTYHNGWNLYFNRNKIFWGQQQHNSNF